MTRTIHTKLTDSSATLIFTDPPDKNKDDPEVYEIKNLKQIQEETHPGIPQENFIRSLQGSEQDVTHIHGYTIYDSAFASMAHHAFSDHLPVELRPDDIHLLLIQGLARFLQEYPLDFQKKLVSFDGKKNLTVRNDNLAVTSKPSEWDFLPTAFTQLLREQLPEELVNLILQDYSQTTDIEKKVKAVTLMGTFSSLFNYTVDTRCFIPEFILQGTEADWKKVAELPLNLINLLKLNDNLNNEKENGTHLLCRWLERVAPMLQQIYQSRCGKPDANFWQSFYKYKSDSGSDKVSGYIVLLYPFLHARTEENETELNKYVLNHWIMGKDGIKLPNDKGNLDLDYNSPPIGPETSDLTANTVDINFVWDNQGQKEDMGMKAGIFSYESDPEPKKNLRTRWDFTLFYKNKEQAQNPDISDDELEQDDQSCRHNIL